jgi:gliding motility-associated protein GldE
MNAPGPGVYAGLIAIGLLLIFSGLISASEVSYFSLGPYQKNKLKSMQSAASLKVLEMLSRPERLLAAILISNNFINISIIVISTFITTSIFDLSQDPLIAFLIQGVVVTFLILLFGEILPKLYANQNALKFALFIARPLSWADKVLSPLSNFMISSTSFINKRLFRIQEKITMVDLSDALDLTTGVITEEKKILKGIVKLSDIEVNEIMKPRMDVVAADTSTPLSELVKMINDSGFSRIPVYTDTLDNVKGILYVKDLLPFLHESEDYPWQNLIRPSYFVPGKKKINILLQEFREKKNHMAIVVDEYGGTEGIITLEDIMEEVVGEITDESDEVESFYTRVDDRTYIFDAKVLLNDFFKTFHVQDDIFDKVRGEADTLAGLILELLGDIPSVNESVILEPFTFVIISVDNRRIKKVKVILDKNYKTR